MVGRAAAAHLRATGHHTLITANRTGAGGAAVVDATAPTGLPDLLTGVDVVVNAIGVLRADPSRPAPEYGREAATVNALFPLVLAEAAERCRCRVVHISTNAVFGSGNEPADERTPLRPDEPYGWSKALGEADGAHVVNIRCSVIGPAPGRSGLWEWFVGRPRGAEVTGYTDHLWTGVTSPQLAGICGDLVEPAKFERFRATGCAQHFVPNGALTKFELLGLLRDVLRPDIVVVPAAAPGPPARPLAADPAGLTGAYRGPRGWTAALVAAAAKP